MRHLHAIILGTGLCVPSLALAATPSDDARPAAKVVATQAVTSVRAEPQSVATPAQDSQKADRARYAAKEAQSGDAKDYRGGDTVVIGASAATAILAVILILVLI
jgi:hypothetical protein